MLLAVDDAGLQIVRRRGEIAVPERHGAEVGQRARGVLLEAVVERAAQRPLEVFTAGWILADELGRADIGEGVDLDLGLAEPDGKREGLAPPLQRAVDVFSEHVGLGAIAVGHGQLAATGTISSTHTPPSR